MSGALLHIAVDDLAVEPLGIKEAVVMALEHLGGVRVLEVRIQEPEQLGIAGGTFAPPNPRTKPGPKPTPPNRVDKLPSTAPADRRRPWSAALTAPAIARIRTGTQMVIRIGVYAGEPGGRCTT